MTSPSTQNKNYKKVPRCNNDGQGLTRQYHFSDLPLALMPWNLLTHCGNVGSCRLGGHHGSKAIVKPGRLSRCGTLMAK